MSSPRRAEALGMDRAGAVVHLDEQVGGMLDERRRAADEDSRLLAGARSHRGEHVGVHAPVDAGPARGLSAGST